MILYSYWRSTTSYRVRIALNLKNIEYKTRNIDLVNAEQASDQYISINSSKAVPALQLPTGEILTQSMAILSYLEHIVPAPSMAPSDPILAAHVHAAAQIVACDIHPINNLRVVQRLKQSKFSSSDVNEWMAHWMTQGFDAYQAQIHPDSQYSFGDKITLADICLVPQLYNAHRWGIDLAPYTRLTQIETLCLKHPAFIAALPENQPQRQ